MNLKIKLPQNNIERAKNVCIDSVALHMLVLAYVLLHATFLKYIIGTIILFGLIVMILLLHNEIREKLLLAGVEAKRIFSPTESLIINMPSLFVLFWNGNYVLGSMLMLTAGLKQLVFKKMNL